MVISEFFPDDKNADLQALQHDLWFMLHGTQIESRDLAMGTSFYFFECARNAFALFEIPENPLFFPEMERLKEIKSFDHRVLQSAHDQIAAFYRWTQASTRKPALDNEESYDSWIRKLKDAEHSGKPFTRNRPHYSSYMLEQWKLYLRYEIRDLTHNNLYLSEQIIRAVLFANTHLGYEAEDAINDFFTLRYGNEFASAVNLHSKRFSQVDIHQGYVYIMINPAYRTDFLKIGKTKRTPERRADELSSGTGVPLRFYVAFEILVSNCDAVEKLVHERLSASRSTSNREFFELSLKDAISTIQHIAKDYAPRYSVASTL